MFFSTIIAPALSLAMAVSAAPVSEASDSSAEVNMMKRQLPNAPPVTANKVVVANLADIPKNTACDTNKYDSTDLRDAVVRAQQYLDAMTVAYAGSTDPAQASVGYPHNFDNSQGGFTIINPVQGCQGQQLEFPILTVNGNVRRVAAGPGPSKDMFGPGPDRVIFTYAGNGGALNFCGIVTHSGLQNNAFKVCT